jgi:branched-chain amino acid transport system substrate-binding protein
VSTRFRRTSTVALLVVLALTAAACSSDGSKVASGSSASTNGGAKKEAKFIIGGLYNLTGATASRDTPSSHGLQLRADQINSSGGFVVGDTHYTIEVRIEDTQENPALGGPAAVKLIDGGAKLLYGGTSSATMEPAWNAAQRAGNVLFFGQASVLDKYTGKGDPVFRDIPTLDTVSKQVAPVIAANMGVKRIGVIVPDDVVGQGIVDTLVPQLKAQGIQVVATERFARAETNFVPLLQRIPKDVDGLLTGYLATHSLGLFKAAQELGYTKNVIAYGSSPGELQSIFPSVDKMAVWLYHGDIPQFSDNPATKKYAETYQAKYPDIANLQIGLPSYEELPLIVEAMKDAGTVTDVAAITKKLIGKTRQGEILKMGFDDKGLSVMPTPLLIVDHGTPKVFKPA